MSKYRVQLIRSGSWWAIDFLDHPRVHSQVRRVDQAPAMAADALSLWLEHNVSADEIEVEVQAGELDDVMADARLAREAAEETQLYASAAMRKAVAQAIDAGLPLRDVGYLLGVTHQRAAAIAREVADEGALSLSREPNAARVVDLMEALQASVDAAKNARARHPVKKRERGRQDDDARQAVGLR